jgi:hypothetical protein
MTTAIVNYEEILARKAAELANKIAKPSGDRIKVTQNKLFKFPDGTQSQGPFEAIIVDFVSANMYYPGSFNRDEVTPPDCFALGEDVSQHRPSANSPNKQADSCSVCSQNQYGSARQGNGKACKNTRLLAILPVDFKEDTPLWLLSVSPTGIKAFDTYVASVASSFGAPPVKVVTTIGFDPKVDYPSLRFGAPKPNEQLEASVGRMEEARSRLLTEPEYTPAPQSAEAVSPVAPRGPGRSAARVQR